MVSRFYSLDVLRGLAALSVVIWHWRHFFGDQIVEDRLPFYKLLLPFYSAGGIAVDLFFCLSGFIFYWLYSEEIIKHAISGYEFFVLRFSRLYPLHLATLLFVAAAQYVAWSHTGEFVVYPFNDSYHFGLQVVLASATGLARGWSFNGPSWSISVEAVIYLLFFAACWLTNRRLLVCVAGLVSAVLLWRVNNYLIAHGLVGFFVGGMVYLLYEKLPRSRWIGWLALGCWTVTLLTFWLGFSHNQLVNFLWVHLILFPITILGLALTERARGSLGKRFALLGDISYSSYLLHFPLQLVFVGFVAVIGASKEVFYSPVTLLLFFSALISLSIISYRYFERPAQRLIRARYSKVANTSCAGTG